MSKDAADLRALADDIKTVADSIGLVLAGIDIADAAAGSALAARIRLDNTARLRTAQASLRTLQRQAVEDGEVAVIRSKAIGLYRGGMSLRAIAVQLGVTHTRVHRALDGHVQFRAQGGNQRRPVTA